jgi:hypothetical protein
LSSLRGSGRWNSWGAELATLAAQGVPLPAVAKRRVEVHNAVQRERAKAARCVDAIKERARDRAREKKADEARRREELKATARAEREVERKREPPPPGAPHGSSWRRSKSSRPLRSSST